MVILLFASFSFAQTTRNVPSQYSTIQAGLNAAQSGDTVLVQPGTYIENIFWPTLNGIKLIAAGDTTNTIIDGNKIGSIITMNGHLIIDSSTCIYGFTLKNGYSYSKGGGICIDSASPYLSHLNIFSNSSNYGGGIYIRAGQLFLKSSHIFSNNGSFGGGIYIVPYTYAGNNYLALPYFIDSCLFNDNESFYYGGAISVWSTTQIDSSLISSSVFANNSSIVNGSYTTGGGAIYISYSNTTVNNCEFNKNRTYSPWSDDGGAAICTRGTKLYVFNSKFIKNSSGYGPGGALNVSYYTQIKNSLFYKNTAYSRGGGVSAETYLDISNVNFIENKATSGIPVSGYDGNGGALYLLSGSYISENVSFIRNKSGNGSSIYLSGTTNGVIKNNNFFNNLATRQAGGIYIENNNGLSIRNTNFISNGTAIKNPNNTSFVDGINNYWGSASGPYHPSQNNEGLGDSVNLFVNVIPFLTSPDTSAPPIPVQNVNVFSRTNNSITLSWPASVLSDLAGYRIYWDTDSSGYPYSNFIDVGNLTTYTLNNLVFGKKYYIAVSCYDQSGNESWFSTEADTNLTIPLPVEITTFQVACMRGSAQLKWITATEQNSSGFEVQRSSNNVVWNKVTFIQGKGNSNSPKEYSYSDNHLNSGKYQYRLKIIDNDGAYKYSAVVEAVIGVPTEYSLSQNFPNPFNPSTKIEYTLPSNGHVKLQVFSVTGQLVKILTDENKDAGYYSIDFNGSNLSSGIYLYRLSVDNRNIVKKMLYLK